VWSRPDVESRWRHARQPRCPARNASFWRLRCV